MNNKKLAINASWIMIGRIFQLVLTFITTMLTARYLGPEENGKLVYVYSYVQLFLPLCTLGLNDIIVKELVDHRDRNDEILGTTIVMRIGVSFISMICSVALVGFFNQTPVYRTIALLQSLSLLFMSFDCLMYFYQSKLLSRKSGTAYALGYVLASVFRIAAIVLKKNIYWFAFAHSMDYLMVALLLFLTYKRDHYSFRFSITTAKTLLGRSYYYIFAGMLVVIYGKVTDTLLLGKMVNETTVGYYSAGTTLCNAWPFVLTAIIDSLSPVIIDLHKSDRKNFEIKLKQLYAMIFYISVAAAIGISLFADLAIHIIYGQEYAPAALPMKIYCWSTAFSYIGVARAIWMQCEDKTRYETLISLFGAFASILLNYLLIKGYGIIGAALAAVLTQFLTNFIFLFTMKETRENAKLIWDAIILKGVINRRRCDV